MGKTNFNGQKLVKKLKQGDSLAVECWFDNFKSDLMKIALAKTPTAKDADDLVQETFINALKNIHSFNENSSLKTWMISILRHEIADFYRKKYAKKAIQTIPLGDHLLKYQVQDSSLVADKVKCVLGKMLNKRKNLLLLKYVDGYSIKEIAKKLGRSFKSVEAELYRARESFKKSFKELEE